MLQDARAWGWFVLFLSVTSPEETEALGACHFEIVPILQLLCELRLSSGLRKEVWVPSLFNIQEPPGVRGNAPDRQEPPTCTLPAGTLHPGRAGAMAQMLFLL